MCSNMCLGCRNGRSKGVGHGLLFVLPGYANFFNIVVTYRIKPEELSILSCEKGLRPKCQVL